MTASTSKNGSLTGGIAAAVQAAVVAFGLYNAAVLVWNQAQTGAGCPNLFGVVPACYVVLAAYLFMVVGMVLHLPFARPYRGRLFLVGLAVAATLAVLGSSLELLRGGVCPQAWGFMPTCYLALGAAVLLFIAHVVRRRAAS